MKVKTRIPITFEKIEDIDSRFQKVKIWLMHLGENYNRSFFAKDIVEAYMHTLSNTPILGFVEESKLGEKDFKGHEEVLLVKDGEVTTKYLGSAYGVIPENCNPRFEQKTGDDGLLREYLVVDGLIWTKFDDAIEILNKADGVVNQSMELDEEFDGYWDDNNIFHFTKFKFYGACMLGENILPAMQKATVEKTFSTDVIESQIKSKLKEFDSIIQRNYSKEVEKLKIEELLAKYNLTSENLAEKSINIEDFSLEELEVKIQEVFTEGVEPEQEDGQTEPPEGSEPELDKEPEAVEPESTEPPEGSEDDVEPEGEGDTDPEGQFSKLEKYQLKFELSHQDIRSRIYEKLDDHIKQSGFASEEEYFWYYIVSVYESYLIVEDDMGNKFYMVNYTLDNEDVSLGDVSEVFPMFLTGDEKGALELMRASFDKFELENKELKEFKAKVESEQHTAKAEMLFSQFDKLEEEDLVELRAEVSNYTLEQLEAKLFEVLGRKMQSVKFSKKDKNPISIKFNNLDGSANSDVEKYFAKHGIKK